MQEIKVLSIEELQQRWDYLLFQLGIEKLLVTEKLANGTTRKFEVMGLAMELEKEFIICTDCNDILIQNLSILMIFLQRRLIKILLYPYKDWYQERLEFSDGAVILIEKP